MKDTKTISIRTEDYSRLDEFRFKSRSRSIKEAFTKLLDKAEA